MWSLQRLCKVEVYFLGAITFFFGVSVTYFTMYYAGFSINGCRETPDDLVGSLHSRYAAVRWARSEYDALNTTIEDQDVVQEGYKSINKSNNNKPIKSHLTASHPLAAVDSKPLRHSPLHYITTLPRRPPPSPPTLSKLNKHIEMYKNSSLGVSRKDSTNSSMLPTIFAVTPTYARHTQRVDLTSLCHTLMHVPNLVWLVVEDSVNKTKVVTNLLERCNSVVIVHMNVKVPSPAPSPTKKSWMYARGVAQRNAGLGWIRKQCAKPNLDCKGVVYFMDDDNKYDLQLFKEIRKTKNVSVFPVGFAGGLKFEGPVCEGGKAKSWHVTFAPERCVPVDMAGFAVNVKEILKKSKAIFGKDKDGKTIRSLEPNFLEQFTTREDAECLGGKEVMVWHVKTRISIEAEDKNPSDPNYVV